MPLTVTVCTGPTCSAGDNPAILRLLRRHPAARDGRLAIETRQCFARCESARPLCPCVRFGEADWLEQATEEAVRQQLAAVLPGAPPPSDDPFAKYLR